MPQSENPSRLPIHATPCCDCRMKVDLPPEVIAAILGHRSIHTASRNYAPARSAKGFRPIVTTADPIAVAQVNAFRKDIAKIESADVHSPKAGL